MKREPNEAPTESAGLEDQRPESKLTCTECRHDHRVISEASIDPRYRLARCPKCRRRTIHVR